MRDQNPFRFSCCARCVHEIRPGGGSHKARRRIRLALLDGILQEDHAGAADLQPSGSRLVHKQIGGLRIVNNGLHTRPGLGKRQRQVDRPGL